MSVCIIGVVGSTRQLQASCHICNGKPNWNCGKKWWWHTMHPAHQTANIRVMLWLCTRELLKFLLLVIVVRLDSTLATPPHTTDDTAVTTSANFAAQKASSICTTPQTAPQHTHNAHPKKTRYPRCPHLKQELPRGAPNIFAVLRLRNWFNSLNMIKDRSWWWLSTRWATLLRKQVGGELTKYVLIRKK